MQTTPSDVHRRRRAALRAVLEPAGITALLITDLINVRYLTGFTGSNAALLVVGSDDENPAEQTAGRPTTGRTTFCTDGRYTTQSAAEVPDLPRLIARPCATTLAAAAPAGGLGFEADNVIVAAYGPLSAAAGHDEGNGRLRPTTGLVEGLRAVKDTEEIDALLRACAIADRALEQMIQTGAIRPGRTERAVAMELDQRMRELGASGPAFETICAAGPNSAIPHHRPTSDTLAAGDFLVLDFGAVVDGYHSDMTRTFVLGAPAAWQRDVYRLVHDAQQAGRDAAVVGAPGDQVDAAARSVIADAGYGAEFSHGLGHGVGLQVHEAPSLAAGSASIMASDMCVTVEPGIYLPGRGGVRIEDSGVIRADGYHVLTATSKELCVL